MKKFFIYVLILCVIILIGIISQPLKSNATVNDISIDQSRNKNDSGKEGEPNVVEKEPLSTEWQKREPDGEQFKLDDLRSKQASKSVEAFSNNRDMKELPENPGVYTPVWRGLEKLSLTDRENAFIQFEVPHDLDSLVLKEVKDMESLWNSGNFAEAIEKLRNLEESEGLQTIAIGISWKVPRIVQNPEWITDVRIGTREYISKTRLDFDNDTGHLFGALKYYEDPYYYWSSNISTNNGLTWQETYTWFSTYYINDISAAVLSGYFYVLYTADITQTTARIRRFFVTDGTSDTGYGFQEIFNIGYELFYIALASNTDFYNNRIYCLAILDNNSLVYYWADATGLGWSEIPTGITNADRGLDACCNEGYLNNFLFISYISTDDDLYVARKSGVWQSILIDYLSSGCRYTGIGAYQDRILTAYEYSYTNGPGIAYSISYDDGDSWFYGSVAYPTSGQYFWSLDVAARKGGGISVVYQEEVGEPDICWYSHRDYDIVNWSTPEQYNEVDVHTGTPMSAEWIPPASGSGDAYGTVWIRDDQLGAFFDKTAEQQEDVLIWSPPEVTGTSATAIQDALTANSKTSLITKLNKNI